MRVVAVHVPHFHVVAHRRRDPALRRRPVALVANERPEVVACSPDAARRGVTPGMSAAAAEAACEGAAVLPFDAALCRSEHDRVGEALGEIAPEIEEVEGEDDETLGSWCFRAEGLKRLHPTEPRLVLATRKTVLAAGYAARVAVAGGRFPAITAVRYGRAETACVPEGREADLLAPFPVEALPLGGPALKRLRLLGVRTLGELARLPEAGIGARFGDEGVHAHRLASGLDPTPLTPRDAPVIVETDAALEPAAESLDAVLFHLRAQCDRVTERLDTLALACWEARLELRTTEGGEHEIPVRLSRPTLSGRVLWTLLRLRLERLTLDGPVVRMRLAVVDAPPARAEQRALFRAVRDDEQLEATVARLRARFGSGAAVSPVPVEVHRPETRISWHDYAIDNGEPERVPLSDRDVRVLRLLPQPLPLTDDELRGRIVCFKSMSEPHRLKGEWWDAKAFNRDYYVVLSPDGRLLWVYRIHEEEDWYLHGEFD